MEPSLIIITLSLYFCLSVLLQALCQLYFDPDMERKNVAQKWLTQAQASAQAWQFCWALLSPDKVCFYVSTSPTNGILTVIFIANPPFGRASLCVEFACFHCACVGFLLVLGPPSS